MEPRTFTFQTEPRDQIPFVYHWQGAGAPKGVLVIAHGMGEHAARYQPLAERMVAEGFAVYANDHRGHGRTVAREDQLGDFGAGGWNNLVRDEITLINKLKADHPGLPVVLMGHSMGSFVVQQLLTEASDIVDAAALSGTTAMDIMAAIEPPPGTDIFAMLNEAFAPTRTEFDWLSRDPHQVDLYVDDPHCGFSVEGPSSASLTEEGLKFSTPEAIAKVRKELPLYLFAGGLDPVGGNGELVKMVAERYREAGVTDVALKLYDAARHEVFNETNRAEVVDDFAAWVARVT